VPNKVCAIYLDIFLVSLRLEAKNKQLKEEQIPMAICHQLPTYFHRPGPFLFIFLLTLSYAGKGGRGSCVTFLSLLDLLPRRNFFNEFHNL